MLTKMLRSAVAFSWFTHLIHRIDTRTCLIFRSFNFNINYRIKNDIGHNEKTTNQNPVAEHSIHCTAIT